MLEAAAEGPIGGAVSGGLSLKDILAAIGESAAEDAAPFIGWVARSPATMSLSIVRTMTVQVTVEPDPTHQGQ